MRHNVYGKKLGRDKNERTALFKSLVQSLIISEKIQTTQVKAKAVKGLVDKLINDAKDKQTHYLVNQFFNNKKVSERLIHELAPRMQNRNSGYTSIIKVGRRLGDNGMLVQLRLILEENQSEKKADKAVDKTKAESKKSTKGGVAK